MGVVEESEDSEGMALRKSDVFVVICSPKANLVRKWLEANKPDADCVFDYTGDHVYKQYRSYWEITEEERTRFIDDRARYLQEYDATHGTHVRDRYVKSVGPPAGEAFRPQPRKEESTDVQVESDDSGSSPEESSSRPKGTIAGW